MRGEVAFEGTLPVQWIDNCENKQTLWPLVRKQTIPTERPPLLEINADFCG
jgi:hypothetical protein